MESKKLLERYAYFYNEINKLSGIDLEKEPDLGGIEISKTAIQMAYRDIKAENFEGGIIDYLCFLSTEMFLRNWHLDCVSGTYKNFTNKEKFINHIFITGDGIRNVLRLVFKNPKYFFESRFYTKIKGLKQHDKIDDLDIFQVLMEHRFTLYQKSIS